MFNTSIGDRLNLGFAYRGLGFIAQAQDEHEQALKLFGKTLVMFTDVGARQDTARVLNEMGRSFFALGNDAEAERITTETQSTFVALEALAGIAMLKAKQGNVEQALKLTLIVLNHPAALLETKERANHLRAELAVQLTPTQMEAILADSRAQTFPAIVKGLRKKREYYF